MNKDLIVILLKVLAYAIGLLLAYLGVSSLASCSTASRASLSSHRVVIGVDTTYIHSDGYIKTKNYGDKW